MYVEFEEMPDHARVWVYQSDHKFSREDLGLIKKTLRAFTENWQAHQHPLRTSFKVLEEQYIVLAVDESYHQASGCSIDSSVHIIRALQAQLQIDLFNRTQVPFQKEDQFFYIAVGELKEKYQQGIWNEHSITLNTLVDTVGALKSSWKIEAASTWLKRYTITAKKSPIVG